MRFSPTVSHGRCVAGRPISLADHCHGCHGPPPHQEGGATGDSPVGTTGVEAPLIVAVAPCPWCPSTLSGNMQPGDWVVGWLGGWVGGWRQRAVRVTATAPTTGPCHRTCLLPWRPSRTSHRPIATPCPLALLPSAGRPSSCPSPLAPSSLPVAPDASSLAGFVRHGHDG